MRGALIWVLASVLTFLVVSLAFLILASFATDPPESSLIPGPSKQSSGTALSLTLDESNLPKTSSAGQREIPVTVNNESQRAIPNVSLVVEVSSEDTSSSSPEVYREEIESLGPGESREVVFDIALSGGGGGPDYPEGPREMVQFRATGEGISAFGTVVIPVVGQQEG